MPMLREFLARRVSVRCLRGAERRCWAGTWLTLFVLSCASCTRSADGGRCAYEDTTGTATITAIRDPPSDLYNCPNDPVEVMFDFVPADPSLSALSATDQRATVGSGANPNRAYILAKGFSEGNQLRCTRKDIRQGSCSPILYEFPDVDLSDYADSCFSQTDH